MNGLHKKYVVDRSDIKRLSRLTQWVQSFFDFEFELAYFYESLRYFLDFQLDKRNLKLFFKSQGQ